MASGWDELPRNWLIANIEMGRADELKGYVLEAVQWGFDQPEGLTNNGKRIKWLRWCREKAWSLLAQNASGAVVPEPGRAQPVDEKPARGPRKTPVRPPRHASVSEVPRPSPQHAAEDYFPARPSRRRGRRGEPRRVVADLCQITAEECNEFLRSLPPVPFYAESE